MSDLFVLPSKATDSSNRALPGAKAYFYFTGSTSLAPIYADSDMLTPHTNPVEADSGGKFPPIYINPVLSYRSRVTSFDGSDVLYDIDPYNNASTTGSAETGLVVVKDFYSTSDGLNYLPAFRAAYAYAKANGLKKMKSGLPWGNVQWWAPTLSMANTYDPFDVDGPVNFLTLSHDIDIDFEFCTISCKAYDGGSLQTTTQAITGNAAWRGCGINVIGGTNGTSSFGIKGVSIRNLILDGGCDRVTDVSYPAEMAYSDYLSHKGFRIQDTGVENLYFENVTLKRFRGEIWYFGQLANTAKVTLVNCNGYTSNQSALNPSSGNITVIGGNYGDAPISIESLGGTGQQYIGTRFYDSWIASFAGAANFTPASGTQYQYNVPMNAGSEAELPWIDFRNVAMDNCGAVTAYNYLRGDITAQDTSFIFNYVAYTCKMIDLDIRGIIHKRGATSLVTLQGPPTLTTAINGSYPAVYCQPLEDIRLRLNVTRTAYAIANSHTLSMVADVSGYLKQNSCQITIDGDPDALDAINNARITSIVHTTGTQKALPRINANLAFAGRANTSWSAANKAISPSGPVEMLACSGAAGTYDITFTNAMDTANGYNYAHGQRLRCIYSGFTTAGTVLRFPNSGNWLLPRDIKLRSREDWIDFSFNSLLGKWSYEAHSCSSESTVQAITDMFVPETFAARAILGSTSFTNFGCSTNQSGGATSASLATTNFVTKSNRMYHTTANAANSGATQDSGNGSILPDNGGTLRFRFGFERAISDQRVFVGLGTAVVTADPSTGTNIVGIGKDTGDTVMQIMHNDASGAATKVSLGANFPAATDGVAYDIELTWPAGMATVNYTVTRLDSAFTASGTLTTNLPVSTTVQRAYLGIGTGSGAPSGGITPRLAFMAMGYKSALG